MLYYANCIAPTMVRLRDYPPGAHRLHPAPSLRAILRRLWIGCGGEGVDRRMSAAVERCVEQKAGAHARGGEDMGRAGGGWGRPLIRVMPPLMATMTQNHPVPRKPDDACGRRYAAAWEIGETGEHL